ncbi:hypothetical protein TSUD_367730 [Trifolium subterraneum]|uniref:E3 ubiquitin-protein ligase RMA n=1 Tax=Trifolium subterraneum TaxID=3900 RepID=A0A2Z6PDM3_TRISU|nr:hypothetical protein TSUD_367730 [Trifolium subterraneum]
MALQHCFSHESKTIPNSMSEAENSNGCFDCNICLDFAHEPSDDSLGVDEHPQCPVCKDDISHTTMIPLYGRGGHAPPSAKSSHILYI